MRALRQSASQTWGAFVVGGTPDAVTIREARGTETFHTNGKKEPITIEGTTVNGKTKWDNDTLKQQITVGDLDYTRTWSVDANGRLVMTIKLYAGAQDDDRVPSKFVYDKVQ